MMKGTNTSQDDKRLDLLTHRHRPTSAENFISHVEQAHQLKRWIQDFLSSNGHDMDADYNDSDSDTNFSDGFGTSTRCALLTGPPGVGKTSLVYTIAEELNLHVVESHSSEKRDSKLFNTLKLANQKGKINPIAKLFLNAAQPKQQAATAEVQKEGRRKRRRLLNDINNEKSTTSRPILSGDTSIVLFDDVDVVLDEDGPFLKTLSKFVRESKRPIVLTATRSIDKIKETLSHCEHIHLTRPSSDECARILSNICKREKYNKLSKLPRCQRIADYFDCDIRQCLNRIHFYRDKADQRLSKLTGLDSCQFLDESTDDRELDSPGDPIIECYATGRLLDLMDSKIQLSQPEISRRRWLDCQPVHVSEDYNYNLELGEQIRNSILELTTSLMSNTLLTDVQDPKIHQRAMRSKGRRSCLICSINSEFSHPAT